MKPEKLVMSAFGSYADVVEIDFKNWKEHGLFLITGDTGAGKTTIFDAIIFALYGETSGEYKESNMLRSQYAKPETPTFVELTFTYQNKRWKLIRNPKYERPAKRGDKMTREQANADLMSLDEMSAKGLHYKEDITISSMCTVFAESEVISLIGRGESKENIAFAVVDSIVKKVASQASRLKLGNVVCLTGGLCSMPYLCASLSRELGVNVLSHADGRYAGAVGAALSAMNIRK